jgi:hypothetical protein
MHGCAVGGGPAHRRTDLKAAGFRMTRVVETASPLSVVEAVAI